MRRVSALIAIAIAAIFAMSFSASAEEPTFEAPELELKFNLNAENKPSGVYIIELATQDKKLIQKLQLIK